MVLPENVWSYLPPLSAIPEERRNQNKGGIGALSFYIYTWVGGTGLNKGCGWGGRADLKLVEAEENDIVLQ